MLGQVLKGPGHDSPAELARRLMTVGPTGIAPSLRGGKPPTYDAYGNLVDPGTLSGIDHLLLVLAARVGPEQEELALYHPKLFLADLGRRPGEGWFAWIQRFFMVFSDAS